MAIQSELDIHFGLIDEVPSRVQTSLISTANILLGARFLSSDITLADESLTGPFIDSVEALRKVNAVEEGRDVCDPGTMILPATLLKSSQSQPQLEDEIYAAMDAFEHDGQPPASKMFIIETTGAAKVVLHPDFRPVKRLLAAINKPDRARLMIVGARQDGLRLLRREVTLSVGVGDDGVISRFEEQEPVDHRLEEAARVQARAQQTVDRFDEWVGDKEDKFFGQKFALGMKYQDETHSLGHWVANPSSQHSQN